MNLSQPFIRRPKATWLLAAALLLAGAAAFTQLPVSPLPRIDLPTINVSAALPGASPTTMATSVAMPLERRFGRIAGVSEITSTSALGSTSITVQFGLDRDVEGAARDIQAAINAAGGDLPPNLPTRPNYRKVNPSDAPILIISLRSKSILLPQVFEAANTVLAQKISQVPGVGQVGVGGGVQPAVRVRVDVPTIAGMGISMEDVRNAIANSTVNQPKGGLGAVQWSSVATDDQLIDAEAWKQVIVHWATPGEQLAQPTPSTSTVIVGAGAAPTAAAPGTGSPNGGLAGTGLGASSTISSTGTGSGSGSVAPVLTLPGQNGGAVRLGDIAEVKNDVENQRVAGWFDGERTVAVIIRRQPGANILDVIDRVKALLPELAKDIPAGIDMEVAVDRSTTIRASVHDVEKTLVIAIGLVVLVVFVFLRSGRATAIPSVVVPLSLIGTFGVMFLLGYSLDNLSLIALTIATGFVVDDAIVVTENITRHVESGEPVRTAALRGSGEIGFTIVSITTSLIAVFIPVLFMSGIVGRLMREFAVTLTIAVVISALISLTLTPMMCSVLLRAHHDHKQGLISRGLDRGLEAIVSAYSIALKFVLRFKWVVFVFTLGTCAGTVGSFVEIFTEGKPISWTLFPQQDVGMLLAASYGPQDISYAAMKQRQEEANTIVSADPAVDHVISNIGGFGSSTINTGTMFIALKPKPGRKESADEVVARLRPKLGRLEGITVNLSVVQDINVTGRGGRAQYQYAITDQNIDELNHWVPIVTDAMRKLPELKDVNSDLQVSGLELDINVDRDSAARFGITEAAVDNALYDAFGQRQVAVFYTQINQYHVVLEASPTTTGTGPDALDHIYVPSANNGQVPLTQIASIVKTRVPLSVGHQSQFPASAISFNLAPGYALGQAVTAIEAATLKLGMPPSMHGAPSGTAQAAKDSFKTLPILFGITLVVVYLVLGILYESYVQPITILSTIFSAGAGALLALWYTNTELSTMSMIGIILLIGIVKKNAILMVDFALEQEKKGRGPVDAIYDAARLRFRPILMTTLAALLGALPLVLGNGTGIELRRPLGIAIIGGLSMSQLLTLFTTPVTYLVLHPLTRKKRDPEAEDAPRVPAEPV